MKWCTTCLFCRNQANWVRFFVYTCTPASVQSLYTTGHIGQKFVTDISEHTLQSSRFPLSEHFRASSTKIKPHRWAEPPNWELWTSGLPALVIRFAACTEALPKNPPAPSHFKTDGRYQSPDAPASSCRTRGSPFPDSPRGFPPLAHIDPPSTAAYFPAHTPDSTMAFPHRDSGRRRFNAAGPLSTFALDPEHFHLLY